MHLAGTSLRRGLILALSISATGLVALAPAAFAGTPPPMPDLRSLTFAPNPIAPNASTTGTVTLTGPAPPGGLTISLSLTPGSAGTAPASVTVPDGQSSAQFSATDLGTTSSWTVTATLFAHMASDTVFIGSPGTHPVVNEVDYDQPGAPDTGEFVELFNPSASTVDLRELALVFVSGATSSEYLRIPLQSLHCLPSGGYAVVADSAVSLPPGAAVVRFPSASDNIRNNTSGGNGVALIDSDPQQLIDSLWYGSSGGDTVNITGFPSPVSLVEGTRTSAVDSSTVTGSLDREPNGTDTDNAQSDWTSDSTPSPGAPNAGSGVDEPGACPNSAPALDSIGAKTVEAGHTLSFTVSGSDPDAGDSALLAYSASSLPAGASFDPNTRQFTWTPTADQVGPHLGAHFEVTDGMASDAEDVPITVTAPAAAPPVSPPQVPPAPPVFKALVPATKMGKLKINRRRRSVTLKFSADQAGATFMCSLDRKRFTSCRSPKTYRHLKRGKHTFRVKARTGAGTDPTPALKKFRL